MKAVVTHGFGESSVEDVPMASPAADEVLIEVDRVQMSVTECWMWAGDLAVFPSLRESMADGGALAFGHEFSGRIVEVGEDVDRFDPGDRVYGPGKIPCTECAYCERGWKLYCENKEPIGLGQYPGALAEYFAIPPYPLEKIPDGVSDAEGAGLQPTAAALVAVHDADLQTGDVVAVIGAGVMGSQAGQFARYMGAETVYAVDIDPTKLELAAEQGMVPVDAREADPVERVKERNGGLEPDVVMPAVGGTQTHGTEGDDPIAQAFRMVRPGGTVAQVGIPQGELTIHPRSIQLKSVDLVYPRVVKGVIPLGPRTDTGKLAAEMVADGRVSLDQFITHELSGLSAYREAMEITTNQREHGALGPAQMLVGE
jgi:L-iditol 2-dehydrogenase